MKVKIYVSGLELRDQALTSSVVFSFLKLNDYQALTLSIEDANSCFDELVSKYGACNLLKEGDK